MKTVAYILVLVGALNWGLVGISDSWNLVELILGTGTLADIVYWLVGLSALYLIIKIKSCGVCKKCGTSMKGMKEEAPMSDSSEM